MRVAFRAWGRGPAAGIRGTVRVREEEMPWAAVVRRLERETRLACCGGPRHDCDGVWEVQLGRRLRTGGFEPMSLVFFTYRSAGSQP